MLDSHTQFRPARVTRKPHMPGRQTALVVGPANEEIWTDKHGRVMVQFDWDRLGERNEKSSCWIRVAQAWSGGRFGAQYLPRVGQEVIVAFLDGDPDRPIITGSLFNKDNMPPYDLPANQTQSDIKSRSSKGGTASNFNELRFEDKKGQEELHFQAEKDMSTLVKHDQTLHVGVNRGIVVGNDETNLVKNERQLSVDANDSVVIGGTHDKTVTGAVTQLYGSDHSRKVDGEQAFFEEKNKDEHVRLAHKLTTDKKLQLNQGATSMTFKGTNVTVEEATAMESSTWCDHVHWPCRSRGVLLGLPRLAQDKMPGRGVGRTVAIEWTKRPGKHEIICQRTGRARSSDSSLSCSAYPPAAAETAVHRKEI